MYSQSRSRIDSRKPKESTGIPKLHTALKTVAAVVVFAVVAWQVSRGNPANPVEPLTGTILSAQVRPLRVVSIARSFQANVVSLDVSPGETVHAGQVLAVLQSREVTSALSQAQARTDRARRRFLQLSSPEPAAEASVGVEQYSLTPFQHQVDELNRRLQELEGLREKQLATDAEVDRGRAALAEAERNLQNALEHKVQIQQNLAGVRLSQLQARASLEDSRLEFEQAEEDLKSVSRNLKDLKVYADWSGTVTATPVSAGELLLPGATLLQLADLSRLSVEVNVGAKIARLVHPHDEVTVRLAMDPPREIRAAISDVRLGTDGAKYIVRVLLPNPDPAMVWAGSEAAVVFPEIAPSVSDLWGRLRF